MSWKHRIEADRSYNVLRRIAKNKKCTVNTLIVALEEATKNNLEIVMQFLDSINVKGDHPNELIAEMKALQPIKIDKMLATPPKKANELVAELNEKRVQKEEFAREKVKKLVGEK